MTLRRMEVDCVVYAAFEARQTAGISSLCFHKSSTVSLIQSELPCVVFISHQQQKWFRNWVIHFLPHSFSTSPLLPNLNPNLPCLSVWSLGEICAFNIQGVESPFEAVVLNGTSGEGQLRARGLVDCESQKEYTFIIQAHDCGSGPGGAEGKKSHKWVTHICMDVYIQKHPCRNAISNFSLNYF